MGGKKRKVQAFLLMIGTICIMSGLWQGDYQDTFLKAIRICLECIGIG